ncbi:4-alpha-glucanotransferase [Gluconacetobacter diazotrophicus PA1 5]|uniref:4-alpha-glucanotransferase n=2 Tax=Gluconacetobacter diazotrophicus TaxID=33996 RepID=A9H855_GLUDA|nr:4-alpha-glucanotransferase [Gluconacetobacter diazotrophicus]ACI51240.1 4-alpha-glucanotransferase [Gluconacetobacter diazotrophicus PA1 5]MBB2155055.1 4-alpha-glucanotransferase [Gluconacetobacter diazotrophicus]TWB09788.1 4-alpha-glucanotransferase [Gluconacetobacter diazotrophicus]CAP54490.1 putative 4-alpha-glucanotransferase [Gluconacetobacter diazotrophicus PA1 5]
MDDRSLRTRARRAGLATSWRDTGGTLHRVGVDSLRSLLRVLEGGPAIRAGLPPMVVGQAGIRTPLTLASRADHPSFHLECEDGTIVTGRATRARDGHLTLPPVHQVGYHVLDIGGVRAVLAIAPSCCHTVAEAMQDGRAWGLAAQIYGLHAPHDGGIGHFGALADLATQAAAVGADALAISPVHAMFAARPTQYSPYSPSSRLFLNVLLADMRCWFRAHEIGQVQRRLRIAPSALLALENAPLIDWPHAAALRMQMLRGLYDDCIRAAPPAEMMAFVAAQGRALHCHAVFEALHAHQLGRGPRGGNWRMWPTAIRNPDSPEVARFADERQNEVGFHLFLQWLAARSLDRADKAAGKAGMKIGLIADLAIGTDPAGSQCWTNQDDFLIGASVGAPPDPLGPLGQNWGLTTFSPAGLHAHGYRAFIDTLRAAMARQGGADARGADAQRGGGVRIDHVMGLERLWIIPDGASATDGAYLSFPRQDLMRLVALESRRHGSVVIGEDLGTVSPGFRGQAARRAIMGMNVLWFERGPDGAFLPPDKWGRNAVAMTTTHDLPTVAGWWQGRDIGWRKTLRQLPKGTKAEDALAARDHDRAALWDALRAPQGAPSDAPVPPPTPDGAALVADAAVGFVGATASPLAILPLEDVLGLPEQPNLPGTISGHPNWQRRYPAGRDLLAQPDAARRLALLRDARRTPSTP